MYKLLMIAGLLAGGVTSAAAADLEAAAQLERVIQFDGYCDGIQLSLNGKNGLAKGSRVGCRGTVNGTVHGTWGVFKALGGGAGATLRDANGQGFFGGDFITVLNGSKNTWAYYLPDGSIFNSGTFTVLAPADAAAAQSKSAFPSTRKQ